MTKYSYCKHARREMPNFITQAQALAMYRKMLFRNNPELSKNPEALKITIKCPMGKTKHWVNKKLVANQNQRSMGINVSFPGFNTRWVGIDSCRSANETWIETDNRRIAK